MAEEGLIDSGAGPESPAPDPGGGGGGDSLRDSIERAFDQVETRDAPPEKSVSQTPVDTPPSAAGERARGPDGRYVAEDKTPARAPDKAQAAPDKAGPASAPPRQQPTQQRPPDQAGGTAPAQVNRAPVSWKAGAREFWAKLPAEVQSEVTRRESEVSRVMQETAGARQALQEMQRVIGPYTQNIQVAANGDAISAISSLFNCDNVLRHGTVQDKAQMAANIIKSYGVDIHALDSILAGQTFTPDPQIAMRDSLRQEIRREMQPVLGYFNQLQTRQQAAMQQIEQQSAGEVESFGQDEAHEFFEDVRQEMADIIDMATARRQPISLQQAYDRAIMMNPSVSEVVMRRRESERVSAAAQAAQRARRAAASISSSPAPAGLPGPAGDNLRAALESAWDQSSGS